MTNNQITTDHSFSSSNGVEDLVTAYHDGIAGWEHGQDNDQPYEDGPYGKVIAEYDGVTLELHVQIMGHAGREYFLGAAAKVL